MRKNRIFPFLYYLLRFNKIDHLAFFLLFLFKFRVFSFIQ